MAKLTYKKTGMYKKKHAGLGHNWLQVYRGRKLIKIMRVPKNITDFQIQQLVVLAGKEYANIKAGSPIGSETDATS